VCDGHRVTVSSSRVAKYSEHAKLWGDFLLDPVSPEASFCATRGSGESDSPFLERLGSVLMRATDPF